MLCVQQRQHIVDQQLVGRPCLEQTQLGRVEYATKGGRLNTDAIDNSAGVDTSDHEVNLKILLNAVEAQGGFDRWKPTRN